MYQYGFYIDSSILEQNVPKNFLEAKGTFREYLREYFEKDSKVLIHLNRKGDNSQQYSPSEIEIDIWKAYFGAENFVNYYQKLNEINPQDYEEAII